MPCLVAQGARWWGAWGASPASSPWVVGSEAKSVGGQIRFVPAFIERVG